LNCHHPRALEPPPFEYIFVVGARCELGEREREMSVVGGGSIEMKRKQRGIKSKRRRKEGRKEGRKSPTIFYDWKHVIYLSAFLIH